MYLILFLLLAVAAVFGGYYLLVHIIQLFTGCNKNEATLKIQRFFNGNTPTSIFNDYILISEIENAISFLLQNGILQVTPEGLKTTAFGNLIAKSNYAVETAVKIKEYSSHIDEFNEYELIYHLCQKSRSIWI